MKKPIQYLLFILFSITCMQAQIPVTLYEQFNGNYDFTFVGNTLNPSENNLLGSTPCTILTTSSADLNLGSGDTVMKAYLYWAGSGTGDYDIKLNGTDITATRTFPVQAVNTDGATRDYFSAWADVTSLVQTTGNGTYTVSDLDLTAVVSQTLYCGIKTNFGGWAIVIVYENPTLPLNQLNLYDGLEYVPSEINISLPSLNVIDNEGAKIGFLAWEGDSNLSVNETLRINGNVLSNPPLNPSNNAFNGTNSITGSNQLYNMDLDVYEIQNFIQIGDQTAEIQLTSGQDFVMINAVMTKLNSQLPDATITVENIDKTCNSRNLVVHYTVHNVNSTDVLPAGTQVGVYVNGDLLTTFTTLNELPVGGSESGVINLPIPAGYPDDLQLLFVVDYNFGITETDETNNSFTVNETLISQANVSPGNLTACETAPGANTGFFDLVAYAASIADDPTDVVTFYTSMADAQMPQNPITLSNAYQSGPQTIYVRVEDASGCVGYGSFQLLIDDCLFPDAVITATNLIQTCNSRTITVSYTVSNPNGLDVIPAGTPVAVFANNILLTTVTTTGIIPIDGNESNTVTITIPNGVPLSFNLVFRVDYGNTVQEINETNNSFTLPVTLWVSPVLPQLIPNLTVCETDNGTNIGIFDFSAYETSLKDNPTDVVTFYTTQADAEAGVNNITNPDNYTSNGNNPQTIYVRLQDVNGCYSIGTFNLIAIDCLFPDGVIAINNIAQQCDSRDITITYTVGNPDSFDILPAGTTIAVYVNGSLNTTAQTSADIAINGTLQQTITINIPANLGLDVEVALAIDDNGTGTGTVQEVHENNNLSGIYNVSLWVSPVLQQPADIEACETFNGSGVGSFDFSAYITSLKNISTDTITFYATQTDADNETNPIPDPQAYVVAPDTKVYVRLEDEHGCYDTKVFTLKIIDCYFPDATVTIDDIYKQCNSRILHIHYTVSNLNGTDVLPAATPVSIYANGIFLDYTETIEDIAIGESESNYITVTIPVGIPLTFDLTFVADDTGNGTGIVIELDENNNGYTTAAELVLSPVLAQPDDIEVCDQGFGVATFNFSAYAESLKNYPNETVTFYTSQQTADQDLDRIYNTTAFQTTENPQRIYVRLDNGTCFEVASFLLRTKKCKPITHNYITPNGDGYNDSFFIEGLRNIFLNFTLKIYNRWGNLVWTGDHSQADWDGIANEEKVGTETTTVPNGTYYFVLELHDPDFPEPIVDWIYVTR
ncbi:CARDB domain-containing protein [Flavobacterium sp. RHBU_3]|uniref:CARDB domain-containing protein n=1 Tax=Flavobacterium sp. RHBU_3 TaxID=3391184 RepID=UPI0039847902